jgi:hypothetical protein
VTAITLGKTYRQDEPLSWGFATRPEARHYLRRKPANGGDASGAADD